MIDENSIETFEVRLGWTFRDRALLYEALTHPTYANENRDAGSHNQRLEFLGDAVVGLVCSSLLFELFPDHPEGELTRRRARVVRGDTLADLGVEYNLGDYIRLGEGQRKAGAYASRRILADAFEALVGAVYLDGGYDAVWECFRDVLAESVERTTETMDFKTKLQERCHELSLSVPRYEIVEIAGPDHDRVYTCGVWVGEDAMGTGEGPNKKAAEQRCARVAFEKLEEGTDKP